MKTSKKSLISAKTAVAGLSGAALLAAVNVAHAGSQAYTISVPEPSALSLMAGGLATAVLIARVRRNKKK
jgi:hypothetical protein